MDERFRVVIYGRSIVLGAVEASLLRRPQIEVITLTSHATAEELATLAPRAILFDASGSYPEWALALLGACPDTQLIAIDPDHNVASVWSGRRLHELCTQDLVRLIEPHGPISVQEAER